MSFQTTLNPTTLVCVAPAIDDHQIVTQALDRAPWPVHHIVHGGRTCVDRDTVTSVRGDLDVESHPIPEWVRDVYGSSVDARHTGYLVARADTVVACDTDAGTGGSERERITDVVMQAESAGLSVFVAHCVPTNGSWTIGHTTRRDGAQSTLHEFE
jgi:hypothetical protein